jgi:type II restriction/modification system DNA methylase subunit YeeA
MLEQPNPDGSDNLGVIRPWVNGLDITRRPRHMWIIDFGVGMPREEAALHEAPFEYVSEHVAPIRRGNRDRQRRENWWRLGRSGGDLREAARGLERLIVTPRVSKYRLFVWAPADTLPDSAVVAVARDDDYAFGVLHSHVHELWARGMGTQLREVESGFRYTPTTCFETFPFPHSTTEQRTRISEAAQELDRLRRGWLDPEGWSELRKKRRTLTHLYNERPQWLLDIHDRLDRAVLAAYGWPSDVAPHDLLGHLLELNLAREAATE